MADAKTERRRALSTDLDSLRRKWWEEGFSAGAESERGRISVSSRSYSSSQQTESKSMTNVSPKTEHQNLLGSLLIAAQRSLIVPTSDSFTIPLENLCRTCGAERVDLVRLFSPENPVTVGDFVLAYEPSRDRVHFTRSSATGAITSFSPRPPAAQKTAASMSEVEAVAKANWLQDPNLSNEFTSEAAYVAFCKADAAGRVRILGRTKVQ